MSVIVTPFNSPLGAEVSGFDPAHLTAQDRQQLRDAFARFHLLVIRDKALSEAELVDYAGTYGTLTNAKSRSPLAQLKQVMVISNIRQDGEPIGSLPDGEVEWHFDRMHNPDPNKAAVLHAIEVTTRGGETAFANMCTAYDRLPADTKAQLTSLTAYNIYDYAPTREGKISADKIATLPNAVHPVLRTLPETGEKALWVSPLMTERIRELPEEESDALLRQLFAQLDDPTISYEHRWKVGDTLIWDNRCLAHRRNDFDAGERRLLKRVAIN